ncbi:hypothetical protein PTI98_003860 [Pleurotus ostreatus]|nr:hypothetical protein PTI98_003860 [Pleurotus ostreatus]
MKYFQATGLLLAGVVGANARTFTVFNACPFTIWPAMFTDLNVAPNVPNFATGWEAGAFTSVSFSVPDNWKAGRIWGRRNCDFSSNPGPNSCLDGGCNGGLLCDAHTGTGVPPASVAEWTLQGDGNRDFYDVSLVDGYNLPMRITNNVGCPVADCAVDLGPNCPAPLKGPFDASGFPVGCRSACQANLDGNPGNSANCCSGSHNTPQTCPPSGVAFYDYFSACTLFIVRWAEADETFREQLPEFLRVCFRRRQRYRSVDLRLWIESRLYAYLLSINTYQTLTILRFLPKCWNLVDPADLPFIVPIQPVPELVHVLSATDVARMSTHHISVFQHQPLPVQPRIHTSSPQLPNSHQPPLSHQPAGLDLIGEPIHFSTGQFAGQVVRAELKEIQKADLGRKWVPY